MTKEDLMQKTDYGLKVYEFFVPGIKLKKKILSPLRGEKDPSFNIFLHRQINEVWFKDFAGGIENSGNCIKFVMSVQNYDYRQAKDFIEEVILKEYKSTLGDRKNYAITREIHEAKHKTESKITPVVKDWSESELNWWRKFGITQDTLERFYVSTCVKYYMDTAEGTKEYSASWSNPIYAIGMNGRFKIYRPLGDRKFKWRSNLQGDKDVFGWHLLPARTETDKISCCFIMAGNKDVMSFHSLTGLPAIAFNSETAYVPSLYLLSLKHNFERVFILYDNDVEGKKSAKKISEQTGFTVWNHLLEVAPGVKDFAQLVDEHPECLPQFMEELKNQLFTYK